MFIECCNNNGTEYLRLVKSVNGLTKAGRKTCKKVIICSIGPLSKFSDGKPDYVKRLKESFKNGSPIIPELQKYCGADQKPVEKYSFCFSSNDPYCSGDAKLFSQVLIEHILQQLGLCSLFGTLKNHTKTEFDVLGFFRLLVYGRVLNPASKIVTVSQNSDYYTPVVKDMQEYNIYRTLDFIYRNSKKIINTVNRSMTECYNRNTDLIFYDVTNFYFEIDQPDEDITDGYGNEIEKGLRKPGVSKEERKLPIVQMGLFMDSNGFPIAINTFPGNTLDHLTVIDSLKNTVDEMKFGRFVFVGDRGMCNSKNLLHLLNLGNGYIVSKSIAKTNKEDKKWIFGRDGFVTVSDDFRYKSRIIRRTAVDEFGNKKEITEKQIVYWSRKFYNKQLNENRSFLEFIKKLEESPARFRITASESRNLKPFLKDSVQNIVTGEIIPSSEIRAMIDGEKVKRFVDEMGYYQIITSEVNSDDLDIIEKYHQLSRIEDQFRIMKGDLDTRPVYVRKPERIKAHFLVCLIALTIIRIIQFRIKNMPEFTQDKEKDWENGMSARRIISALNKWTVEKFPDNYYRINGLHNPNLQTVLKAFGIDIPLKLFTQNDLRTFKSNIKL